MTTARSLGAILATTAALALAAPATAAANPVPPPPVWPTAVVTNIVDGDTVDVFDINRGQVRVRVLGIDTPEVHGRTDCWGPEASMFAANTLLFQLVAVVGDPTQAHRDAYGRDLAYLVKPDGWNYSTEAARVGAARSYVYGGTPTALHGDIATAENQARTARHGLWGACTAAPAPPPAPRQAPPPSQRPVTPPPAPQPDVYYRNCDAARAAGAAPIYRGQPGYRPELDRDNDGIACEWA